MDGGSNPGKTFFSFLRFFNRDALNDLEFQVYTTVIFAMYRAHVIQRNFTIWNGDTATTILRAIIENVHTFCGEKNRVGHDNVNYWASFIVCDAMPEPVVINLDSDVDDSLIETANESENEICLAMK